MAVFISDTLNRSPTVRPMPETRLIQFIQSDAPIAVEGCPEVLDHLRRVLPFWPFEELDHAETDAEPFLTIRHSENRYHLTSPYLDAPKVIRDAVDVACSVAAQLAQSGNRAHPDWLCCHTAAVEFSGQLVMLPAIHKTGKSTLTACLAAMDHRIFTDDYLPISVDDAGLIHGISSGIAPRLRLPVPEDFSDTLKAYFAAHMAVKGWQYGYLSMTPETLGKRGDRRPIGAVVLLDRDTEGNTLTSIEPASQADVLRRLIIQNFAREGNAARALKILHFISDTVPLYSLRYSNAEDAAKTLSAYFAGGQNLAEAPVPFAGDLGAALPETYANPGSAIDLAQPVARSPDVTDIAVEDQRFVVDHKGYAIHHLDAMSGAVWTAIETPQTAAKVTDMFAHAFPDQDRTLIAKDIERTLRQFAARGLVVQKT